MDYTKENTNGYRDYNELKSDFFQGKVTYNFSKEENLTLKYSKFKSKQTYPAMLTKIQMNADRENWRRKPGEYSFINTDKDEAVLNYNNKISSYLSN